LRRSVSVSTMCFTMSAAVQSEQGDGEAHLV
jgi:hypothetical protein